MSDVAPQDSTTRFSNRVDDYRRFRPGYPDDVLTLLADRLPPRGDCLVADVGSGTGIFTRQLLDAGYRVVAVEPNAEMARVAAEELGAREGFEQRHSPSEELPFTAQSIDLITAAQAFHWFDPDRARAEWLRVLKPGGLVALIWNNRLKDGSDFARGYEELLQGLGTDYRRVDHDRNAGGKMRRLWRDEERELITFPIVQHLDREGLHGRVASSSYTPAAGAPGYDELHAALDGLFDRCAVDGMVPFAYVCEVYIGRPSIDAPVP